MSTISIHYLLTHFFKHCSVAYVMLNESIDITHHLHISMMVDTLRIDLFDNINESLVTSTSIVLHPHRYSMSRACRQIEFDYKVLYSSMHVDSSFIQLEECSRVTNGIDDKSTTRVINDFDADWVDHPQTDDLQQIHRLICDTPQGIDDTTTIITIITTITTNTTLSSTTTITCSIMLIDTHW